MTTYKVILLIDWWEVGIEGSLGSGDFVPGYSYHMSVRNGLPTIQCRPNSKANGLVMLSTEVKQHWYSQYLDG
jgi:hypothetical protein